jgi:zinc transport system substrate-binding protein
MFQFRTLWLCLLLLLTGHALAQPAVRLLASSQPLALILGEVLDAESVGQLRPLLSASSSLHHPSLRPSERAALDQADAVIWLGSDLEPGLANYMQQVSPKRLITVSDHVELELLPMASSKHPDSHVWLSPNNAVLIARAVADELLRRAMIDKQVLQRVDHFALVLEAGIQSRAQILDGLSDKSYIAFHDAYAYLARNFGLRQLGFLVDANEQSIGLKAMWNLQQQLDPDGDVCLLTSPQFGDDPGRALTDISDYHAVSIDILGAGFVPGAGQYIRYMTTMLDKIVSCFVV